jgi:hypothetical protein
MLISVSGFAKRRKSTSYFAEKRQGMRYTKEWTLHKKSPWVYRRIQILFWFLFFQEIFLDRIKNATTFIEVSGIIRLV